MPQMNTGKRVAILLVFYKSENHLDSLFRSILAQTYSDYRIYAIENSVPQTSIPELKKVFPDSVILPFQGNLGFAKANNLLAERAIKDGCKYLFVLNPDMELTHTTIETLNQLLENNKEAAACSAVILYGNEKRDSNIIQLYGQNFNYNNQSKKFLYTGVCLDSIDPPVIARVDFVNGGSLFIRSQIFKEAGLFNENYFMYNDEIDLAYRIKKMNKSVLVTSKTKIYHHHDWTDTNKTGYYLMYYYMMRNRVLFFRNYKLFFNLICDLILQIFTLPVKIKWLTGLADFKLVRYYYLGLWRGLAGETGKSETEFK